MAGPSGRDRAAAHHTGGTLPYDEVVLVVEGQARRGVPEGQTAAVRTVHAPGSGDDQIVATCTQLVAEGTTVTLASADRGLIARLGGLGVGVAGPRSVRDR